MKPILLAIKPVNNSSSLKFNLSNRTNLVNSIGIGPRNILRTCQQDKISYFKKPENLLKFEMKL